MVARMTAAISVSATTMAMVMMVPEESEEGEVVEEVGREVEVVQSSPAVVCTEIDKIMNNISLNKHCTYVY